MFRKILEALCHFGGDQVASGHAFSMTLFLSMSRTFMALVHASAVCWSEWRSSKTSCPRSFWTPIFNSICFPNLSCTIPPKDKMINFEQQELIDFSLQYFDTLERSLCSVTSLLPTILRLSK